MDDPDATLPVPRPTPRGVGNAGDGERITESGVQGLFDAVPSATPSASRQWQPPSVEDLQQALPQYEISAFIARGGMGAVYKGTQKTLKRTVAIKVLPPHIDDGEMHFAERFKHEAQAMARLSHPNIVAVYDAGEVEFGSGSRQTSEAGGGTLASSATAGRAGFRGTLLYFVMEFIEGTDVHRLIMSEGRIDPLRAMSITAAVCDALAFAHEEGIIHRDIKPSNIMLDKKGRVKVADFGLAKAVNLDSTMLTRSDVTMGTPDYVAPEALIAGIAVDGRADLYAVGVMFYQMLTGKIPRGRFQMPSGVIPQIDPRFDAIIDKAMQTDREHRYSSALEMKADVERVATAPHPNPLPQGAREPESAQPSSPSPQRGEGRGEGRNAAKSHKPLLIAAAVIILAAGAFFVLKKPVGDDVRSLTPPVGTSSTEPKGGGTQRLVTSSPSLPASASSSPWQPLFTDAEWKAGRSEGETVHRGSKVKWSREFKEGLQHLVKFGLKQPQPAPDGAIRAQIVIREGSNLASVSARNSADQGKYQLATAQDLKTLTLIYTAPKDSSSVLLGQYKLPKPSQIGDKLLIELRLQGEHLTGLLNGVAVIQAQDQRIAGAGAWGIDADDGWFESVEVQPLPDAAVSKSPPLPVSASADKFPPGQWVRPYKQSADINQRWFEAGAKWEQGWITPGAGFNQGITLGAVKGQGRNWGARAKFRWSKEGFASILLRRNGSSTDNTVASYDFHVSNKGAEFRRGQGRGSVSDSDRLTLGSPSPVALIEGQEVLIEAFAIGDTLYGCVEGKVFTMKTDGVLKEGGFEVATQIMPYRDIEFINLDGLSEAEALKLVGVEGK